MGATLKINLLYTGGQQPATLVSLTPSYERRTYFATSDSYDCYGAELGLGKAAFARIGRIRDGAATALETWGFGVSSFGVLRALGVNWTSPGSSAERGGEGWRRFDVTFSFARYLDRWQAYEDGTNFYAVTVSF